MKNDKDLRAQIENMGPWHHKVKIRDGLYTGSVVTQDKTSQHVSYLDTANSFKVATDKVLPKGLEGRSFLDCACNAGGYSFAAKDAGAGRVYGFDIREHWINQANFIKQHREADSSDTEFEVADLLNFGREGEKFDVTWFSGIFYHLPDPVGALKLAADRTRELLFLNTACVRQQDGVEEKPGLVYKQEGTQELMSGVYRLSWLPTGPKVLTGILNWMGFSQIRTYFWLQGHNDPSIKRPPAARIAMVAAREEGRLDGVPSLNAPMVR